MGKLIPAKNGMFIAKRHRAQSDKKDQDAKRDAVGVKRKEIWRPEQENGHRGHVEDGGKS